MPSAWYIDRQRDVALLERRKAFLGRSRVGALAGAYTLIAITVALTAILFAAVARVGSEAGMPPRVMAISDGNKGLQVIQADPIPASRVSVLLSAPGRVLLNGAPGAPVVGTAVPLAAEGRLSPGDTFQVCTVLPVQSVEMVLRDQASGAVLERHTFASPAICTP